MDWRARWVNRWPNFSPEEVLSSDQLALCERGVFPFSFTFMDNLQAFRDLVGPLLVNHAGMTRRGFRSPGDLAGIYEDARYSFHLWCACDVSSSKYEPVELFYKALEFRRFKGLGLYPTFLHLDGRDSFWDTETVWHGK